MEKELVRAICHNCTVSAVVAMYFLTISVVYLNPLSDNTEEKPAGNLRKIGNTGCQHFLFSLNVIDQFKDRSHHLGCV